MRISRIVCAAAVPALVAAGATASPALANGQNGTTLTATTTASVVWEKTFSWTLEKTVTPDNWTLEVGESGTSTYTVTATKGAPVESAFVKGQTCVTNGGVVATEGLSILQEITVNPDKAVIASAAVDLGSNAVLEPGQTACYDYAVPLATVLPGKTYKSTANVSILNHSGSLGTAKGPAPSATAVAPSAPTLIDNEITVTDDMAGLSAPVSTTIDETTTWTYDVTFTGTEPGTKEYVNTVSATTRTGTISDSATVRVTVNEPQPGLSGYGRTPGYWKNHTGDWPAAYSPTDKVGSVFQVPAECSAMANDTLLAALEYKGGPKLCDKAANLLRIGTSAVLSAEYYGSAYGDGSYTSTASVIGAINDALAKDAKSMAALQKQLDQLNNGNHDELPKG